MVLFRSTDKSTGIESYNITIGDERIQNISDKDLTILLSDIKKVFRNNKL
jgi:hypothetical protein